MARPLRPRLRRTPALAFSAAAADDSASPAACAFRDLAEQAAAPTG
ncbi:hypothetical protein [Streptomyces sp. ME19-01-6]|nr:hypothetical protein [Streptomyces sp. ME19-01-6]MDX3225686.1 hypothetical protein [Streptomyces sp. ME19-01-6]